MSEAALAKISEDLDFLKNRMAKIETTIEEIDLDFHRKVKTEYVEKLKKIDAGKFLSEQAFEKELAEWILDGILNTASF